MKSLLVGLALILAGCSTLPSVSGVGVVPSVDNSAKSLAALTSADLKAAAEISKAYGDTVGQNCALALDAWLSTLAPKDSGVVAPPVIGPASAFALARVHVQHAQSVVDQIKAGVPEPVHVACAPVAVDANLLMLKLGGLVGGAGLLP